MTYRLSNIYTRSGDSGTTGIAGARVEKDSNRIHAIGDIDELNAAIGCALAEINQEQLRSLLIAIQHHLFNVGGELAYPDFTRLQSSDIRWLENWIDFLNRELKPLEEFVLPNGDRAVSVTHLARTVCRRAERQLVHWSREQTVRAELLQYINRLSDLLFVVSRVLQLQSGCDSVQWNRDLPLPLPGG